MADSYDRHIFLYAKGWYKHTDLISDLKVLLAQRSGVDEKYISIDDIILVLSGIAESFTSFSKFIQSIREQLRWNSWQFNFNNKELIIYTLLSQLSFVNIHQINFELGKPDKNILPLRNEME